MPAFLSTMAIYLGVLLVCSLPMVLVASRNRYYRRAARRFLLIGLACGLICGLVVASSDRLIERCQRAGNTQCFDAGATGLVTVVIIGFLATSLVRAYLMMTE